MKISLFFFYVVVAFQSIFFSCTSKTEKKFDELNVKKISFMEHAVDLVNHDGASLPYDKEAEFKIVTYGDLTCPPCSNHIWEWKKNIKFFDELDNVTFLCYLGGSMEEFKRKNEEHKLPFPVYLDINDRFRLVNKIGSDPGTLTFLLNRNNEIILVGNPFTEEMRQRYMDLIK